MGDHDARVDLAEVLARLERLEARERQREALEAEVVQLRAELAERAPASLPAPAATERGARGPLLDRDAPVGRRRAIKTAAAAAAAAAVGATVLDAQPAAAANGDHLVLGSSSQGCTAGTGFAGSGTNLGYGLLISDNSSLPAAALGSNPTFLGHAKGTAFSCAVLGYAENYAKGIWARSAYGTALRAESTNGFAAEIYGTNGASLTVGSTVNASGPSYGIRGASGASGMGVSGLNDAGIAVDAQTNTGTALRSISVTGTALYASSGGSMASFLKSTSSSTSSTALYVETNVGTATSTASNTGRALLAQSNTGPGAEINGQTYALKLGSVTTRQAPTNDTYTHYAGEIVAESGGGLWLCVYTGTPGAWRKIGGIGTAGQFHNLTTPIRTYDSRVGTTPAGGTKSPLVANTARTIDLKNNGTGVPIGATAVAVNVTLMNATNGQGVFKIWTNGFAAPAAQTLGWNGSAGTFSTFAVTGVDNTTAYCQVLATLATDVIIDVVGYYR